LAETKQPLSKKYPQKTFFFVFQFKLSFDCNVKDLKYKPLFKLDFLDHKSLLFSRIVIDGRLISVIGLFNEFGKKKGTDSQLLCQFPFCAGYGGRI